MIEALNRIYKGKDAFVRQVSLFSICGIFGVLDFYFLADGIEVLNLFQIVFYLILWIIFSMYIIGYEVIFLNERQLPDIDLNPFRLAIKKPLIYILLLTIPLTAAKVSPKYVHVAFLVELLLAVPLTMIQAGYSYNYNEDEAYKLYENSSFKDYVVLFFKRVGLFALSYLIVSFIIFLIFFAAGVIIVLAYKGNIESVVVILTGNQFILTRLSNLIGGILLIYTLTISTLVWDYELIKTYEKTSG